MLRCGRLVQPVLLPGRLQLPDVRGDIHLAAVSLQEPAEVPKVQELHTENATLPVGVEIHAGLQLHRTRHPTLRDLAPEVDVQGVRFFVVFESHNLSMCTLLDGQGVTTDTTRTSPALASVYMTSSLRPSSVRPVCTRLFGLGCIGGRPLRTLRISATVTRLSRILLWPWRIGVIFMAS